MDANGQRFWLLADRSDWSEGRSGVSWDDARRTLRLAGGRTLPAWPVERDHAEVLLEQVPMARDAFGTWARAGWVGATAETPAHWGVLAAGGITADPARGIPEEVEIAALPEAPTDLMMGYDGLLYVAGNFGVAIFDPRGRRVPRIVPGEGIPPWRLAADPEGGAWVINRAGRVGRLQGMLERRRPLQQDPPPGVFTPEEDARNLRIDDKGLAFPPGNLQPAIAIAPIPPRFVVFDAALSKGETAAGIAVSPGGRIAVLSWAEDAAGGHGMLRLLDRDGVPSRPIRLLGHPYPYALAWAGEERVAVMVAGPPLEGGGHGIAGESFVYAVPRNRTIPAGAAQQPVGDIYPLRDHDGGPFAHVVGGPSHYPTTAGTLAALHRITLPAYVRSGTARTPAGRIDSGDTRTVWHRLYLEAAIPAGCGVVVHLAATDHPAPPAEGDAWFPHRFGASAPGAGDGVPAGCWLEAPSEIPFHDGMLCARPVPNTSGLWTALVQRAGRRVRTLRGRYLWARIELSGTGRATPEVAALRVYGPRFSYAGSYLPELYREDVFGAEADEDGTATPADFLDRFLGIAEGVLTPLEDRVAKSYVMTDARTAPAGALEWLAGWVGLALDPALSETRRRAMLAASPELARRRGTLPGLALALETATGGAVSGGEVVIVEEFRLRRTFSTILGADLADEDDPLLAGIVASGNAYVGDTLFLGESESRELMALFGAQQVSAADEEAVRRFFDRLAGRVAVLVHQKVDAQDLGVIARVVEREAPAHVNARVIAATYPLLVGVSALVAVDTYMAPGPVPLPVRVEESRIGERDMVQALASLDPRLGGGAWRTNELG